MADEEGNKGDLKYFQNQPYDMEVDLNNEDEQQEEQNYQEASSPIQVKELPKFDLSKFEDLPASAEAKELLSIMKK